MTNFSIKGKGTLTYKNGEKIVGTWNGDEC